MIASVDLLDTKLFIEEKSFDDDWKPHIKITFLNGLFSSTKSLKPFKK